MRLSLGRLPSLRGGAPTAVICNVDGLSRYCLSDFDQRVAKGSFSKKPREPRPVRESRAPPPVRKSGNRDRKFPSTRQREVPATRDRKFPAVPVFSDRVREIIPLAVRRQKHRPKRNEWMTIDPRNPKNKIVTTKDGERMVKKGKQLIPLYRDWEAAFGKPIGDGRPYYRKNMGPMLMPYEENPKLETLTSLVVVEGLKDLNAIRGAVNAHVFVCDGASILSHIYERYIKRTIGVYQGDVILLMDPDTAGRRMRTAVNALMEPCRHAFISEYDAIVGMGTINESIGIENASSVVIRHALEHTRSYEKDREALFPFDVLYEMGLVQTPAERIEGVRLRRRFTCGFLGIGFCDGKQLMKQLNGYGFSLEEVKEAMGKADVLVEEWKAHPWRLQKDYTRTPRRPGAVYNIPKQYMEAF